MDGLAGLVTPGPDQFGLQASHDLDRDQGFQQLTLSRSVRIVDGQRDTFKGMAPAHWR